MIVGRKEAIYSAFRDLSYLFIGESGLQDVCTYCGG